ncbi:MAG: cytochrome c biogenesis protein CcdA [Armatimonadota bacterium]
MLNTEKLKSSPEYTRKIIIWGIPFIIIILSFAVLQCIYTLGNLYQYYAKILHPINLIQVDVLTSFTKGFLSFFSWNTLIIVIFYFCYLGYILIVFSKEPRETSNITDKEMSNLSNKVFIFCLSLMFIAGLFISYLLAEWALILYAEEKLIQSRQIFLSLLGILLIITGIRGVSLANPKSSKKNIKHGLLSAVRILLDTVVMGILLAWILPYDNFYLYSVLIKLSTLKNSLFNNLPILFYFWGLAVPFILISFVFNWLLISSKKISDYKDKVTLFGGRLMLIAGISLFLYYLVYFLMNLF